MGLTLKLLERHHVHVLRVGVCVAGGGHLVLVCPVFVYRSRHLGDVLVRTLSGAVAQVLCIFSEFIDRYREQTFFAECCRSTIYTIFASGKNTRPCCSARCKSYTYMALEQLLWSLSPDF